MKRIYLESTSAIPRRVSPLPEKRDGDADDRVEKAYRRASKNLSETSSTHTALLHLQQSLSADVQRANADHLAILSSKQGSLLLSVAAHAGIIGTGLTNYHSESLKVAATNYKDIEYCKSFQDHGPSYNLRREIRG